VTAHLRGCKFNSWDDPQMKHMSRCSKVVLAAIIIISGIIGLLRLNSFQVGAFPDDAHYIVLAESISSGQGYRLINFPHAPVEWAFPPGWPLLLSPIVALFPGNYTALKLLSLAFWLASIFLTYRLFAKRIATPYLEILVGLVALNPIAIGFSGMVMSEAAYIFFSLLTLNLFEFWNNQHNSSKNWLLIAVVGIALYTQLIRTIGLSILLTIIGYLLFLRRFRQTGIVVVIIILGLILQLWLNPQSDGSFVSPGYQSQALGSPLTAKISQMWANLQSYMKEIIAGSLVLAFKPSFSSALDKPKIVPFIVNIFVLLLLILGIIRSFRRFQISDLYVGIYFAGVLAFWNPDVPSAQTRYLIPIIPFLYFYLLQGIIWFARWIADKKDRWVTLIVIGLVSPIMLLSLGCNFQDLRDPLRSRSIDLTVGADWVYKKTPQKSVIMARNPITDYLYARRKTVEYPPDGKDIEEYIKVNSVDYIIISPRIPTFGRHTLDDFTKTRLLPVLTANPEKFVKVYTNTAHNVTVYEVHANNR